MEADFVIVGSGLTGATLARMLHDNGFKVLVLERRSHVGGNVYDHYHESGIRVHTYGPHYFRTSSEEIWRFVNRFASFYSYEAVIQSVVDGIHENWPIAGSYIKKHVGPNWQASFKGTPSNFEEACLALMPELVYQKFVKGYNIKQWGVNPTTLAPSLIKRFDVRENDEPRLMPNHKYQGLPTEGYAKMMESMLKGIPVLLNCDYLKYKSAFRAKHKVVFTGPIDEYFGFSLGKLKYRGQKRIHEYLPDTDWYQPLGQINNPQMEGGPHIRTLEWKHMMQPEVKNKIKGTVITREVTINPENSEDFEYPFPDEANRQLFEAYRSKAAAEEGLLICGRLGEYKYYDMDQAIGRAFMLYKGLMQPVQKKASGVTRVTA